MARSLTALFHDSGVSGHRALDLMLEHYNDPCDPAWEAAVLPLNYARLVIL